MNTKPKIRRKSSRYAPYWSGIGGDFPTTTPSDTTPPVISNVVVTPTVDGAVITWTTDEASDSAVDYGLTASYGSTESDINLVTSHEITITGLDPDTLYHYRIRSSDAASNEADTDDATFTTEQDTFTGKAIETAVTGNYGIRNSGVFDDTTVLTVCFWFMIVTDKNASSAIWGVRTGGGSYLYFYNANGDGTTFLWEITDAAAQLGSFNFTVGQWYFVAISKAGNGSNQTTVYRRRIDEDELTSEVGTFNNNFTPTEETFLVNGFNTAAGFFPGRITSVREWTDAKTEEELLTESQHYNPQVLTNLFASYPMDDNLTAASCLEDESGNNRDLTETGTLTLADGPTILQ